MSSLTFSRSESNHGYLTSKRVAAGLAMLTLAGVSLYLLMNSGEEVSADTMESISKGPMRRSLLSVVELSPTDYCSLEKNATLNPVCEKFYNDGWNLWKNIYAQTGNENFPSFDQLTDTCKNVSGGNYTDLCYFDLPHGVTAAQHHHLGFVDGNHTGYDMGFKSGFSEGVASVHCPSTDCDGPTTVGLFFGFLVAIVGSFVLGRFSPDIVSFCRERFFHGSYGRVGGGNQLSFDDEENPFSNPVQN